MPSFLRKLFGDARAELVACPACGASYVVPVAFEEDGPEHWWMRLRCGECGGYREAVVENGDAERYDAELGDGMREIRATADRLDRERMQRDVETLIDCLRRDLIDVGDFAR
jgi:ribosomal protein S27AE